MFCVVTQFIGVGVVVVEWQLGGVFVLLLVNKN